MDAGNGSEGIGMSSEIEITGGEACPEGCVHPYRIKQLFDQMVEKGWGGVAMDWPCPKHRTQEIPMSPRRPSKVSPLNAHYKHGSIDPCQYVKAMGDAEYRGACVLNILKYITRYPYKGTPMQDLMKAQDYLNMLVEHQKEKDGEK